MIELLSACANYFHSINFAFTLSYSFSLACMQGSLHHVVSVRDTLDRSELITLSEDLLKYGPEKVTWLAKQLGIQKAEIQSLMKVCASDDLPLLVLLEWKKRHSVASRPHLARSLLDCGFTHEALKLDETSKCIYIMYL